MSFERSCTGSAQGMAAGQAAGQGSAGKRTRVAGLAPTSGEPVYRSATGAGAAGHEAGDPGAAFAAATQGGASEVPYRADMERLFGHSFANVKAHLGGAARDGLDALGAHAAAQGESVAFATATPDRKLVAHELAHVVQRRRGAATTGGMSAPGDAAEVEAEAVASKVAAGEPVSVGAAAPAAVHRDQAVQPSARAAEKQASRSSPGGVDGTAEPASVTLFNYAIESAELKTEHRAVVTELHKALAKVPKGWLRVVVVGHADDSGEPAVNTPLSKQRAEAVRKALATPTVPVTAAWRGESQPVADNTTADGRSKNRRVVVEIWPTRALPGPRAKRPVPPTTPPKGTDDRPPPVKPPIDQPPPVKPPPVKPPPVKPPPVKPSIDKPPPVKPPSDQRPPVKLPTDRPPPVKPTDPVKRTDPPKRDDDKDDDDEPVLPVCSLCALLPFAGGGATAVGTGVWWVVTTGAGLVGTVVHEVSGGGGDHDGDHDPDHDKDKDPDKDPDKDKDPPGGIRVEFDHIDAANTPAKMSARLPPSRPHSVGVRVSGWAQGMAPIRITAVSEEGSGTATLNGQQYLDVTASTTVLVTGHEQTAPFAAERVHLGAMYEASHVGHSNDFAIAAIPQNVRVEDMGRYNDHPDVGGFKVMTFWESDSGNLGDLDAVRFGETVETVVKNGPGAKDSLWQHGRRGASEDGLRDNHSSGFLDLTGPMTMVSNQVWMFDDHRTDAGERPVPQGGFQITRDVHVDKARSSDDKTCLELTTTKAGAAVSAHGNSTTAGVTEPSPITYNDAIPCGDKAPPVPPKPKTPTTPKTPKKTGGGGGASGDAKAKPGTAKVRHVIPTPFANSRLQAEPITRMIGSNFAYVEGVPDDPSIGAVYKATLVYKGLDGESLWAQIDLVIAGGFDQAGWIVTRVSLSTSMLDMNPLSKNATRQLLLNGQEIALHESFLDKPGAPHRTP